MLFEYKELLVSLYSGILLAPQVNKLSSWLSSKINFSTGFVDGSLVGYISPVIDVGALAPNGFTHKLPIVVNGETYYMLLKT